MFLLLNNYLESNNLSANYYYYYVFLHVFDTVFPMDPVLLPCGPLNKISLFISYNIYICIVLS